MTKQRALILRLIRESGRHMTAEELYQAAKTEMPGIALATVYNNLIWLSEAGEIKKLTFRDRTDRYDKSSIPHIHLICDQCGKVSDHPSEGLQEQMEKKLGFPVHEYELAIHYTCENCQ